MTLVRPLMTSFKMTVTADCIVYACSPLCLSIKLSPPDCQGWGGGVGLWTGVHPPRRLPASEIKQNFLSTNLAS